MRGKLSKPARAAVAEAMAAAAHGMKGATAKALAARYKVAPATVYRAAERGGARKRGRARREDYRAWVRTAVAIAHNASPPAPLDLAIRSGVASGELPPEAAAMPEGTARRIARELDLRPGEGRTQRMHADYPMQAVQFDGSTSMHLSAHKALPGGDWVLKLHRRKINARGYKNKPLAADRMRVVTYGAWDMCTGIVVLRYVIARGENAHDAVAALTDILEGADACAERPLCGVPENLWADHGALFKAKASRDLVGRLGIALPLGAPGRKERQGGIEQAWRRAWERFERSLFLPRRETILLSEVRLMLREYERERNRRPSRTQAEGTALLSRAQAWTALMSRRPADLPLRGLPANALATLHREGERRIDRNGIVRWDGVEYECAEWHSRWVTARQALSGAADELILEDPATGERAAARRYRPRKYGEVKGRPATALDQLLAAADVKGGDVYAPRPAAASNNVVALTARAAPAADLENPLDASAHGSIAEAMAAFAALYPWPLSAHDRAAVEAAILEDGLRRSAVTDLAAALLAALDQTSGGGL